MKRSTLIFLSLVMAMALNAQEFLTIERAIEIAMKNSPDIRRSELSMKRSFENLNAKKASQKSQFSLTTRPLDYSLQNPYDREELKYYDREYLNSGLKLNILQPLLPTGGQLEFVNSFDYNFDQNNKPQYDRNGNRIFDIDGDEWFDKTSYLNDIRVSYTQPLFTYNTIKMEFQELKLDYENSEISFAITQLNVEKNVRRLFYDVYQKQQSLDIAKEELKNNDASYEIIKNKVEAGLSAVEELYQAELNRATTRSDLYNKEVALANAKDNFLYQIGMDIDFDFMAVAKISVEKLNVDLNEAVKYALENRMELREREIEIENSTFALVRAKSTNEFKGSFQTSLGLTGRSDQFNTMMDQVDFKPNISFSFNIPLYDWGERKARIKSAELGLENSKMNLEFEEIDIILGIRQIHRNLTNLYNQIEIAQKNVENAELTYEINLERYKNGDLTSMDLNLFQNQLSNKKNALTGSIIDYNLELLNLKIQTLFDFEKGESIVPETITKAN